MAELAIATQFRPQGQLATQKRFIPNVPVTNHLGEEFLFYDDLVKDRVVILNLMSIDHDAHYPVARNLAQVQRLLGWRLGREAWLYSITVDPQHDSLERLRVFARRHQAGHGWQFLRADAAAINLLHAALFVHDTAVAATGTGSTLPRPDGTEPHLESAQDCSMGLMRYGNDAMGLWASVPAKSDPKMIVERLSWVMPREPAGHARLKRGGPLPQQRFR